MYFKINKGFLQKNTKENLVYLFAGFGFSRNLSKKEIISHVFSRLAHYNCNGWICFCPYCRNGFLLVGAKRLGGNPRFCMGCGKTSPLHAFDNNTEKTKQLLVLASKMNRKDERTTKDVLVQQALITVITGLEVLMREAYSLIYDHHHVVLGKSVFEDIYSRTRNEFLNLGSASRWLRKVTSLDIRRELTNTEYKFLSRMFSARHIIIHNCSIKDRDFLSQTGEPDSELNKPLQLKVPQVRKLISVSKKLVNKINEEMRQTILNCQNDRIRLIYSIRGPQSKLIGISIVTYGIPKEIFTRNV